STPLESNKPLIKDEEAEDVDVRLYRSMIGLLMYLTTSRPDITFDVCVCARLMIAKDGRCFVDTSEVTTDETIHKERGDRMERAATTTSSLEAEYDSEDSIRSDIRLDDAEGTACLLNEAIFKGLACMGYEKPSQKLTFYKAYFVPQWKFMIHTILQCLSAKTTAWNEFSSTMASAIICLADNQKFNFSKYIFDNMVKSLEGGVKFYLFLRFLQVFLDKQVKGMSMHNEMYVISSHTKKNFANMRRIRACFSGGRTNDDEISRVDDHAGEEVVMDSAAEPVTTVKDSVAPTTDVTKDEITLAQVLAALKSVKPKVVVQQLQAREREEFIKVQKARLEMRKVNDFVAMDSEAQNSSAKEAQESSTKRTSEHLESDISKKQKVDENVEPIIDDTKELKKCMEIVPDDKDEVLIEATLISSRSPTIIDYKIHKEGKKNYFKIIRADVKDRFKKEKSVDDMDNILFRTLKTMFEHHVEDTIWKYQQRLAKVYPLTRNTLHQLWSDVRLQVDYEVEMAYDLLRFIRKQPVEGYTPQ
nr:synaptobrevin, longin-like domain protein [Tanacetum cinerariifolium]